MSDRQIPAVRLLGDSALLFEFGDVVDAAVNARALAAWRAIEALRLPGVRDIVPAYASVAVHIDPSLATSAELAARLLEACATAPVSGVDERCIEVPVCYEPPFASDMDELCAHTGLTATQIVTRHSAPSYRVFFLGFTPGFPYLGGLDPALAMPRRDTPRVRVEAGSVAIGGAQTGIYPSASPGGWRIIGRTPLRLFDHTRETCCLLAPGDKVHFVPVSRTEFARISDGA